MVKVFGYLMVNTILRITLHLQMLCRQLEDQQVAHPTIFISGAKSHLTKAFVLLAPFLDQTNPLTVCNQSGLTYMRWFVFEDYIACPEFLKTGTDRSPYCWIRAGVAEPLPGGKTVPAKTLSSALQTFLKIKIVKQYWEFCNTW